MAMSGRHRVLVAWRSSGRLWEKQGFSLLGFTHKDSLEILGRDTKGDSILSRFEPGTSRSQALKSRGKSVYQEVVWLPQSPE